MTCMQMLQVLRRDTCYDQMRQATRKGGKSQAAKVILGAIVMTKYNNKVVLIFWKVVDTY